MKFILSLGFLSLFSFSTYAYIMPTRVILQKTVENSGSGTYAIEQEVQFSNGSENVVIKENWLIENDRTMRVTISGTKNLQSQLRMQFTYNNGQRYELHGSSRQSRKISEDFLEKYLNFRSAEQFANSLIHLKLVPSNVMARKSNEKSGSDFKYTPESFVRYSRTGGSTAYAFGEPTPAEKEVSNPGIWIEQDQFLVRKVKLPSQVELTADNYSQFAKGLSYPRERTIRWGNNTATIRLISVSARNSNAALFQPASMDIAVKLDGLNGLQSKDAILEFYSRFR